MDLQIHRQVEKFLRRLQAKQATQLQTKISSLQDNPYPSNCTRDTKDRNTFKVVTGEFCILYSATASAVCIEMVGRLNDKKIYHDMCNRRKGIFLP